MERDVASRRWDSLSRRCRARSSLRFSCSVLPGSVSSSFFFVGCLVVVLGESEEVGGLEDCLAHMLAIGPCDRNLGWEMGNYHEGL